MSELLYKTLQAISIFPTYNHNLPHPIPLNSLQIDGFYMIQLLKSKNDRCKGLVFKAGLTGVILIIWL